MISPQRHIVKTLLFDTHVASESQAAAFAEHIRSMDCESSLNRILDQYDTVKEKLRIDAIVLDVGEIDLENMAYWWDEIENRLHATLRQELQSRFSATPHSLSLTIQQEMDVTKDIGSLLDTFLHFLYTGALIWHADGNPDMEDLLYQLISSDNTRFKDSLLESLKKEVVLRRITINFNLPAIESILTMYLGNTQVNEVSFVMNMLREEWKHLELILPERKLVKAYLKSLVESKTGNIPFSIALLHHFKDLFEQCPEKIVNNIRQKLDQYIEQSQLPSDAFAIELKKSLIENPLWRTLDTGGKAPSDKEKQPSSSGDNVKVISAPDEEIAHELTGIEPLPEDVNTYFIDQSGLVLLNQALLQSYFEKLAFTIQKQIPDEEHQHKIILWLDYLVWGDHQVHEYGLILPKVLAGLHPSAICDIRLNLNANEKEMALELLKEVVAHWSILKNTQPESLRTAFLQRKGRLQYVDNCWQLHVTSSGYDILIDSLPWNYSIIKFPWMKAPLFTQWKTKV